MNIENLPRVTSVISILDKPGLSQWANQLGLSGINVNTELNRTANIGTAVHQLIQHYLLTRDKEIFIKEILEKFNASDGSDILFAFEKFVKWSTNHSFTDIEVEKSLHSKQYRGTIDILSNFDNKLTLIDIKTSKKIYISHEIQVAAYCVLLCKNNIYPQEVGILRVGINDDQIEYKIIDDERLYDLFVIFQSCLKIYNMSKKLK